MTKKARQTTTSSQSVFTKSIGLISRLDPSRNLLLESRSWTSLLLSCYLISKDFQWFPMISNDFQRCPKISNAFQEVKVPLQSFFIQQQANTHWQCNNSLRMIKSENDFQLVWSSRIIFLLSKVPLNNRFPERSRWLLSLSLSLQISWSWLPSLEISSMQALSALPAFAPTATGSAPRGKQQQKNSLPYQSLFPPLSFPPGYIHGILTLIRHQNAFCCPCFCADQGWQTSSR